MSGSRQFKHCLALPGEQPRALGRVRFAAALLLTLIWTACSEPAAGPVPQESATGKAAVEEPPAPAKEVPELEPPANEPPEPAVKGAILRDITAEAGLNFAHFNGFTGEYFLPEITGSGGALFDYDNDGDLDIYIVQGAKLLDRPNPEGFRWKGDGPPRDLLFRNDISKSGKVKFTDVTETAGIRSVGYGMGVAAADYDNDGWVDLYVTNLGSNLLLRNNGKGGFSDVTASSGADDPRWSTSATFFDFDRDGWLDLYVAAYVDFSVDSEARCFAASSARDYCGPDSYAALPDRLFRNRRDGTFEDVTSALGISKAFGAGLGVVAADLNADGWSDIYVANDGDPNQLWINQQGKGFVDEALLAGVALNQAGRPEAGMGVAIADFDEDGDEDLFLTHLDGESNTLYVNLGAGFFEDRSIQSGLHAPSLPYTAFGAGFFDYDNDGWLDLLVANGAVRQMEALARRGERYPLQQKNQLYRNNRRGGFEDISATAGPPFQVAEVSRGVAFGDIDNDGDTDVAIFNNSGPARVLLNESGQREHWLGIRLVDDGAREDLGRARVEVLSPDGRSLWRRGHSDGSYCSASDPRILVGLGGDGRPRTVRVHWPRGGVEEWENLEVDQYVILKRGNAPHKGK